MARTLVPLAQGCEELEAVTIIDLLRRATAYPGVLEQMDLPDVELDQKAVIRDGSIITSRGPGTAMDFALALNRGVGRSGQTG